MAGFVGVDELLEGRHFDREVIVLCVLQAQLPRLGEDDDRTRPGTCQRLVAVGNRVTPAPPHR